jgi:dipeptidyl aminopeptidase/acylaminoacyl peptidase
MKVRYPRLLKFITLALLAFLLTVPQIALSHQIARTELAKQPSPLQRVVKPKPIVVINRKIARQTKLLSAEEVEKITVLQKTVAPRAISQISPDGTTVVITWQEPAAKESTYRFLNIHNGSQLEIASDQFQGFQPDWFHWRDEKTVIAIASKEDMPAQVQYVLLKVDGRSGKVGSEPLVLPGVLTSVAPDASKILVKVKSGKPGDAPADQASNNETEEEEGEENGKPTEFRVLALPQLKEMYRFALPTETSIYRARWTPDSSRLAIVRGWQPQKLSEFSWEGGTSLLVRESQDAMGLLLPIENPYLQKSALIVIDLQTGDRHTLPAGKEGAQFGDVSWSPDGHILLARVFHPLKLPGRTYPIYSYIEHASYRFYNTDLKDLGQVEAPELANFEDEGIASGQFAAPDEIAFIALNGMNNHLYLYSRRSGELRRLSQKNGTYSNVVVDLKTRQIVFQFSSFTEPPELYRLDLNSGETMPLTALNQKVLETNQTRADAISFSLARGEAMAGILIQPADAAFPAQDVPLVVWQEGGPASSMTNQWGADVERPFALLPNFGISVLVLPIYGRYGFGTERFNTLYRDRNFGQVDIDAMAEVVEQAIAKGYTSPGKVGITGCSYGGYFTLQSIIRHPALYAAANPQCSWVDMLADWAGANPILPPFVYGSLTPYIDMAEFQKDSPAYNSERIQTPLLIFHGSNDRLPITMLENIYSTVAANGTPARMVKFIKAGHGLVDLEQENSIPEYQLYAAQEMIQWFRTYLIGMRSEE